MTIGGVDLVPYFIALVFGSLGSMNLFCARWLHRRYFPTREGRALALSIVSVRIIGAIQIGVALFVTYIALFNPFA